MGKKIAIITLALLTIGLGVIAVFIAIDLNNQAQTEQPDDTSVTQFTSFPDLDQCNAQLTTFTNINGNWCITGNNTVCTCGLNGGIPTMACTANSSLCETSPSPGPTPQPTPTPQPNPQVCTPFQWFGCGYQNCSSGQSARCNADGTGHDCFDDPSACGSSPPPTPNPTPNPTPTPTPMPPPASQSSSSSSTTASANQPAGGGSGDSSVSGNLPETGIIDENPQLVVGLILIFIGIWATWVRSQNKA